MAVLNLTVSWMLVSLNFSLSSNSANTCCEVSTSMSNFLQHTESIVN
jgi:hypothetical protein